MWGLQDIDKEGVGKWNPEEIGTIVWDDNFDLAPEANQQYLYDFCLGLRSQEFVSDGDVTCWIESFKEWVES